MEWSKNTLELLDFLLAFLSMKKAKCDAKKKYAAK